MHQKTYTELMSFGGAQGETMTPSEGLAHSASTDHCLSSHLQYSKSKGTFFGLEVLTEMGTSSAHTGRYSSKRDDVIP
jgi:hypothetical protein